MKIALSGIVIIGLFGLAIFSFTNMAMADGHGHMNCIATVVQGSVCPEAPGTVGFINFHANAAKFFSTAVFGVSALLALTAFLTITLMTLISDRLRELPLGANYRLSRCLLVPTSLPNEALNYWLLLHEKRDPAIFIASARA